MFYCENFLLKSKRNMEVRKHRPCSMWRSILNDPLVGQLRFHGSEPLALGSEVNSSPRYTPEVRIKSDVDISETMDDGKVISGFNHAPMDDKSLNVLCLDGGGVRGLSSLLILRDIMIRLQRQCNLKEVPLPCEVFDLICGTSTGGIIALMLGRLHMSIEEAINGYIDFSRTVFGENLMDMSLPSQRFWNLKHTTQWAVYDASILEEWVQKIVASHRGDPFAPLKDPLHGTSRCCRTFVVAIRQGHADFLPRLFRSYATNTHGADTCAIWKVARATTAGMPFFDPMVIGLPPVTYMVCLGHVC